MIRASSFYTQNEYIGAKSNANLCAKGGTVVLTEGKSEGQQALDLSPQIPQGTEGSREKEKANLTERRDFLWLKEPVRMICISI